ncbi:hypothetical protein ABN306_10735 [Providencia huaxiensis]|uniref:DUF4352 domain-containing protein n=1 Tax=Providencia huaxiensis TaxID=2027290 RepID=A0ABU2IWB0_9GAMM|nr:MULTISPECIES: hypothetical protein [Providencia]MBZ3680294.1 hypothetical protein [Providencia rettgeri]AXH61039.1 hypothetical protein CYG50_02830 [Providencia huaxiensis]MDT0133354.1 hypothetical protein [Providencia huaxiensis]MDT1979760.1 hypothetical protein [Providencia huaxiensis]QLR02766.1 hypothetical protein H0912_08490 [Providencia rettgeri]
MKKIAYMLLFTSAWAFANTDDSSTIKSSVKSITSSITSSSKDALSGLKEGIDEGRTSGSSVDGAIIIYDIENLNKYIDVKVLTSEKVADNEYLLTLSVKNKSDSAVRLTNLEDKNNLYILDKDGFTSYLSGKQEDISVPKNAASKVRLKFLEVEDEPSILRLYDLDIKIPAIK